MPRKVRLNAEECFDCFGCGHLCTLCEFPVNACDCDLDLEGIIPCSKCGATGVLLPDPTRKVASA